MIIPAGPYFSEQECLWYLYRGYDEVIYRVIDDRIIRAFSFGGRKLLVSIQLLKTEICIELLAGDDDHLLLERAGQFVKEWLDIENNLAPFYELLAGHATLSYMAKEFGGLRSIGIPDLFEALCWAIIGQQINLSFAHKLKRRLVEAYGEYMAWNNGRYYIFPEPAVIATLDPLQLQAMQFSASKAKYLIGLANAFADGTISKGKLMQLPDFASRQQFLTGLKGIGTWTANYALMKSLKEPSSIPYGDAGLNNALLKHGLIKDKADKESMATLFNQFKGWEAYLVIYLWRSLAVRPDTG
jgi:DNA-3-methyladenine glycosylase II